MSYSLLRYPGGKSKLSKRIIEEMTPIDLTKLQYREPFFGGGSVGLSILERKLSSNLWINDKDIGMACLWTAIFQYPEVIKTKISDYTPSVQDFYDIKKELLALGKMPDEESKIVDIGFKKLVIHQISYSGLGVKSGGPLGGEKQESKYKIDCRWSSKNILKKIDKMRKYAKVRCTNLDFSDLIKDESCEAFIYLDPPYYVKGNELYHNGFTTEDHARLASDLRNATHPWILSYDDCEQVRTLYGWTNCKVVDVKYSITALKNENGPRLPSTKPELLIFSKDFK